MVLTACFAKTPGDRPFGPSPLEGTLPLFLLRGERVGAAPWRKAMRRDIATWAVRAGAFRRSGRPVRRKNAPLEQESAPATAEGHVADCALGVAVSPGNKKGPEPFGAAPVQLPAHRTPCAATASRPAHRDDRETPLIREAG